jgi:ADP-ribosyl-[dinitrogen reductase] hydrolase
MKTKAKGLLLGIAIGDALGVPVEFVNRKYLRANPVTGMRAFGTHHQPAGTWSDDSSLSFCLVENLIEMSDYQTLAYKFVAWYTQGLWTARGNVFDIGLATRDALLRLQNGVLCENSGGKDSLSNGNGSLMRILPLAFHLKDKGIEERFDCVKAVSSITHAHIRSVIACFFAIDFSINLLRGLEKFHAFYETQNCVRDYLNCIQIPKGEQELFVRLLYDKIWELDENDIYSSGYVIHTLEASIWAFLRTDSFENAVLEAVNLGDDSDTTGAVTGGIAGLYYGHESVPSEWLDSLARVDDIQQLAKRFCDSFC